MASDNIPRVKIPMAALGGGKDPTTPTSNQGEDTYSNNSDEALEVTFDDQNPYRRKSSMVSNRRQRNFMADASCFVHSLLESQKHQPDVEKSRHEKEMELRRSRVDESDQTESRGGASVPTNSRLLTKKQLAEMAWGVRELSKHLGSIRIKLKIRNVFILVKSFDVDLIKPTRDLVRWLLGPEQTSKYNVYVENTLEKHPKFDAPGLVRELSNMGAEDPEKRLKYWDNEMCRKKPNAFDFGITMGGDGTVLYASWLFQQIVPPCLSFALGSLGFLTKFEFKDAEKLLTTAFQDGISVSLRLRFECTVMRSQPMKDKDGNIKPPKERDIVEELVGEECDNDNTHKPDGTYMILNDVVVDRGPSGNMCSTELFGDDEYFTNIQADGVCVATPTGSTAYNLGAGGSLCHPDNPVMLISAIAAHTLTFRPIILPDTIVLRMAVPYNARTPCMASFDGKERVELGFGDYVSVSASRYPFAVIMNTKDGKKSEDWVRSISEKLDWNTRKKQKPFSSDETKESD